MACSSCSQNKGNRNTLPLKAVNFQELFDSGEYNFVTLSVPGTHTRIVGSPTGIIRKDGLTNYGRAKHGSILLVHNDDIVKNKSFQKISLSSPLYQKALDKYRVTGVAQQPKEETVPFAERKEKILEKFNKTGEDVVETPVEPVTKTEILDNEVFNALRRSDALTLLEFRDTYGFTHHMAVLAKVRTGELKSFKEGDTTYIYHVEDEE